MPLYYEQFKIMEFKCWDLYLHENQFPYLGRCYASSNREEANLVTDITSLESTELFSIVIPSWHNAIKKLFGRSRPNVAILGNEWNHLHVHLIPRFKEPKRFYDIEFIDPNPKGNYSPYPKKEIPLETLLMIKEDIKSLI